MSMIQVEHLVKNYGKEDSLVQAVNDLSLTIEPGEFVAIVGPSGCGKSTLLHLIGGVDCPTSGNVFVNGQDLTALKGNDAAIFRRKNIALIYQFYNLIPVLNVRENMILPAKLDHRDINEEEVNHLLELFQLKDRELHLPSELSGGQQQRVAIARALLMKPALLLADEPTGNLDSQNSKEVIDYLCNIHKKEKQTIVLVTHDDTVAQRADRIITMKDGKIVKDEVIHHERTK